MTIQDQRAIPRVLPLFFLCFAALFFYVYSKEKGENIHSLAIQGLSFEKALVAASLSKKPVMVDFYAVWCEPCRKMERDTYRNPGVLRRLENSFIFIRINIDDETSEHGSLSGRDLAAKYSIHAVPTHIVLDPDGGEMGRILGYHPPERFLTEIDSILSMRMEYQ